MAVALIFVVVAVGSVLFHLLSPWWFTPIASNWSYIDATVGITFLITGIVFTAVILFMAYCIYRYRHTDGRAAAFEPESKKLESWLGIATAGGVAAMLAPGLFVWYQFVTVPDGTPEFEVVGQQWQWSYRLPGQHGLGKSDAQFVSADNPLGINPNDPAAQDNIVVIGEDLHLPVGKPAKMLLRSIDVIHDFWVPEFRAKMDLMPGLETRFWFTPTRTGTYEILCAGFCGIGHPQMRGNVIVESEADYQAWLNKQKTFAELTRPRTFAAAQAQEAQAK
ncbi:MAG TPA: cytochrome c oxidase subunit II [Acetobacteraceae bacterium]|nr:cytochrome c oxidase subunit II [Acetobacteraceae bacterium]